MFGPFITPYLYGLAGAGAGRGGMSTATPGIAGGTPPFVAGSSVGTPDFTLGPGFGGGFGGPTAGINGAVGASSPSPSPVDPFSPDPDARRRARNAGLLALGTTLLGASSSGDIAGGIAQGFANFQSARDAALDRDMRLRSAAAEERRRQNDELRAQSAERRASAAEIDRDERARLEAEAARLNLDHTREDRTRQQRARESTAQAATRMVSEIEAVAAADPSDATLQRLARQAAAYNRGEDSDLDSLTRLHTALTARAGEESDFARETERLGSRVVEQARQGYGPIAEARRANQGLALEQERLGIYRMEAGRRADQAANGSSSGVKPATWYDDVDKELNKLVDAAVKERTSKAGEVDTQRLMSPEYQAEEARRKAAGLPSQGIPYLKAPTPDEIDALRRRYEPTAIGNVNRIYGLSDSRNNGGGSTTVGGPSIVQRGGSPNSDGNTPDAQGRANHLRNQIVDTIMSGGDPNEGLGRLRSLAASSGGTIFGYTPEQYIENARRRAQQLGWNGGGRSTQQGVRR